MSSSSLLAQIRSRTGGVEHAHTPENAYEGGARHSSSLSSSRINPRDRLGRALEPSRRMTDEQHYREYRKKIAALLRARGGSTTTDVMLTIAPVQANSHHTLQRSKKLMKLFKRALKKQATLRSFWGVDPEALGEREARYFFCVGSTQYRYPEKNIFSEKIIKDRRDFDSDKDLDFNLDLLSEVPVPVLRSSHPQRRTTTVGPRSKPCSRARHTLVGGRSLASNSGREAPSRGRRPQSPRHVHLSREGLETRGFTVSLSGAAGERTERMSHVG